MLVNDTFENQNTDNSSISADYSMTENEEDKPSIVVETHTIIDPNTMMIKFLIAYITHATVLGAGRLCKLACLAFVLFLIHHIIKFIAS